MQEEPNANVLIVLVTHTSPDDGFVFCDDQNSYPINLVRVLILLPQAYYLYWMQFLYRFLRPSLWCRIARSKGATLMIPMVCGWLFHHAESLESIADLLRDWEYEIPDPRNPNR